MEPDKSLKEALLRSHQATEKANQAQHQLFNMSTEAGKKGIGNAASSQPELHETPRNLLQSWDTLRQLDEDLAEKEAGNKKRPNTNGNKN